MTGQLDTKRMRASAPLLPAPGDQVIVECLDEIDRLRAILDRHPAADGVVVTESVMTEQSSYLARDIVFWWGASNKHGSALYEHLRMCGAPVPEWLYMQIPNTAHTPAKGAVAAAIYRAMIEQHQSSAILSQEPKV